MGVITMVTVWARRSTAQCSTAQHHLAVLYASSTVACIHNFTIAAMVAVQLMIADALVGVRNSLLTTKQRLNK